MPTSPPQSSIQLESINHSSNIILDHWQRGTWEEFIEIAQQTNPNSCQNSRGYYYNGWMRLEPTRSGADQARSHAMIPSLVGLYAALAPMKLAGYVNPIIQRCQQQQAQPHLAFYIDRDLKDLPTGNAPIDLDREDDGQITRWLIDQFQEKS